MFKVLREKGLLSSAYIDDLYLQGDTFHECHENALNTGQLLRDLGTSCLHPSQQLEYLGFVLNSVSMTVRLSHARVEKVVQACEKLLSNSHPTTLHLAEVIWLMVSSFPAVEHGPLYYRSLAIFLSLKALCGAHKNKHIQVQCDNTTAVSHINNIGGSKSIPCNEVTKQIWALCIANNNWLSATYLSACKNVEADAESRVFNDRTEWMLDPQIFKRITNKFGSPEIDLFASRLNKQYAKYSSWRPDPEALFVDAFSVNWNNLFFYAFPPFSLIGRCLEKLHANQAEGILIVPRWMSQSWFPKLLRLLVETSIVIHPKKETVRFAKYPPAMEQSDYCKRHTAGTHQNIAHSQSYYEHVGDCSQPVVSVHGVKSEKISEDSHNISKSKQNCFSQN